MDEHVAVELTFVLEYYFIMSHIRSFYSFHWHKYDMIQFMRASIVLANIYSLCFPVIQLEIRREFFLFYFDHFQLWLKLIITKNIKKK